jgi:hypothetical protein
MATSSSPSPIIEVFIREVHASFPDSEKEKLAAHETEIAATTSDEDPHRARLCAKWPYGWPTTRTRSILAGSS